MNLLKWAREITSVDAVQANTVEFMPVSFVKHPMPRREIYSDFWHCQNGAESLRGIPGLNRKLPYGCIGPRVVVDMTTSLLLSKFTSWNLRKTPTAYTRYLGKSPSGEPKGTLPMVKCQVGALTKSRFLYSDAWNNNSCNRPYEYRVNDDRPWMHSKR